MYVYNFVVAYKFHYTNYKGNYFATPEIVYSLKFLALLICILQLSNRYYYKTSFHETSFHETSIHKTSIHKTSFSTKRPFYKTSIDTKRPPIQNVLLYKMSNLQNVHRNKTSMDTKRPSLQNVHRYIDRQDLKALCEDFYNVQPSTYMVSIVKFFNE